MAGNILAFHYDLKRAMWSAAFMDGYAATLADWGYNAILYEVEDKLRFPCHPTLAHADALSIDATRARLNPLRRRGLRMIPLVQSLAHAEYVLTKPGYEHLRESPAHHQQYNPLSAEARDFILERIDETIAAVQPEEFFHLGGDETWSLGQSEPCKPVVEKIGKAGLYLRHMLPIVEHVVKRGLRPILWADMALTHPEIVREFPRELVWMDWDYWTPDAGRWDRLHVWGCGRFDWEAYQAAVNDGKLSQEFVRCLGKYAIDDQTRRDGTFRGFPYADALRDRGFDVIVAPATRCYGDSMGIPFNTTHMPNCFAGARKGREAGLGACVTSWTVRHSHPLVNLPGAFAAARGFSDSGQHEGREKTACAFAEMRLGAAMPEFAEAMRLAEARTPWSEAREMKPPDQAVGAVRAWLDQTDQHADGRAGLSAKIETAASDLARAEAIFLDLRSRAKTHADDLDYWMEGVRHTSFCAAFSLAVLRDRLALEAPALRKRLDARRDETRRLFSATFPAVSVEGEVAVRYAFHEAILNAAET